MVSTAALDNTTAGSTFITCRHSEAVPRSTASRKAFSEANSWQWNPDTAPMSSSTSAR
ncbi:MAG: hypothetical protein QM714_12445 [Nocardioides sp.]|uniref:hypothetical protein n=1 Tax=Nocardioides sp. TaxID=35761 RepID=UPI0039E3B0DB